MRKACCSSWCQPSEKAYHVLASWHLPLPEPELQSDSSVHLVTKLPPTGPVHTAIIVLVNALSTTVAFAPACNDLGSDVFAHLSVNDLPINIVFDKVHSNSVLKSADITLCMSPAHHPQFDRRNRKVKSEQLLRVETLCEPQLPSSLQSSIF